MYGEWMGDDRIIINQETQDNYCPMCDRELGGKNEKSEKRHERT